MRVQNLTTSCWRWRTYIDVNEEHLSRKFSVVGLFWPRRLCVWHPRWRLQYVAGHCPCHRSVFLSFRTQEIPRSGSKAKDKERREKRRRRSGSKAKDVERREKRRKVVEYNGQYLLPEPKSASYVLWKVSKYVGT